MTEGVIIAIITGICAAIVAIIGQWGLLRKNRAEDAAEQARLDERTSNRLDAIEKKLDIHNGYAEKFGEIQVSLAVIRGEIETLKEK